MEKRTRKYTQAEAKMGTTGPTGSFSFTDPIYATGAQPPPDILTLADIASDHAVLVAKEQTDGAAIRSIGTVAVLGLKPVFVEWYSKGCPNSYPVYRVSVVPPPKCSDGVVRTLADYIDFCSGSTLTAQIALFQAKLPDIRVSFANLQGDIAVIVSKDSPE